MSKAYEEGRRAGRLKLAHSLNPHPDHTHSHGEWARGWLRESNEIKRDAQTPAPKVSALVIPHASMTGAQIELLCRREGLALARLGRDRFVLLPTANAPETMLRIAVDNDREIA